MRSTNVYLLTGIGNETRGARRAISGSTDEIERKKEQYPRHHRDDAFSNDPDAIAVGHKFAARRSVLTVWLVLHCKVLRTAGFFLAALKHCRYSDRTSRCTPEYLGMNAALCTSNKVYPLSKRFCQQSCITITREPHRQTYQTRLEIGIKYGL